MVTMNEREPQRRIAVIALTPGGTLLAGRLGLALQADLYCMPEDLGENPPSGLTVYPIRQSYPELMASVYRRYAALICIMACGIAVRGIGPLLRSKQKDPAVVVVDEKGRFAISLAGGHLGGANQLARQVAAVTGGEAVITTATDLNGLVAFDLFAQANDCRIEDLSKVKTISAALLRGEPVGFLTDCPLQDPLPPYLTPDATGVKVAVVFSNSTALGSPAEATLVIRPRNLIVGIGCKKGIAAAAVAESVSDFLARHQKSELALKAVASIDLKREEAGIIEFCAARELPFVTVERERIRRIEASFATSAFVKQTVGVGCVAEPCALLGGVQTRLIAAKAVYPGITLALAEEERKYKL